MKIPEWATFGASEWGLVFAGLIWAAGALVAAVVALVVWFGEDAGWAAPFGAASLFCLVMALWIFWSG